VRSISMISSCHCEGNSPKQSTPSRGDCSPALHRTAFGASVVGLSPTSQGHSIFAVKGVALKRHANVCGQKFIMA